MASEKSLQVAEGLRDLAQLVESGKIEAAELGFTLTNPRVIGFFSSLSTRFSAREDVEARAKLQGAVEAITGLKI